MQRYRPASKEQNNTTPSFCRQPGYYSRIHGKKKLTGEEYQRWDLNVYIL